MTVQFVLYIHVDIMIVQSIETFGWCFLVRRAGETVFNNLSWALLTWSQSTSVTSVSVFKMLGKNLPSIFRYTRAAGTWDQVSMEWHPKNPHCEDHGEVVHWATSRWDISMVPPQVVDPRYSKGGPYSMAIFNRMGPNDQEALLLNETEYSKGLIATRQNQKTHRDLSMTRITIHQNPTVWHKFAQPTHLAQKKTRFFWAKQQLHLSRLLKPGSDHILWGSLQIWCHGRNCFGSVP